MTRIRVVLSCIAACLTASGAAHGLQVASAFVAPGESIDMIAEAVPGEAPDSRLYADGNKAIHDGKWSDAVKLFDMVAVQEGEHAAAALYWKAYAQNKMGQPASAMDTCLALRMRFAKSGWVEDCGALEIEIRASKGQPVQPQPGQSDELKLLALATQMQKDPVTARAQIEQIVQGDSSEHLKEAALFLLGETVPELRYAQVVRISHLEGDVRIARVSTNEKSKSEAWEAAEMNLPVSSGDSLVTGGDGRAEIEFENASTVYLAPNSVLAFDDLHTTSGVPHSEIDLLSGTITLHLDSLMAGETFVVNTPTNVVLTRFPQKAEMRVSSFADGMAVAALAPGTLKLPGGSNAPMLPSQPLFFNKDHGREPLEPGKLGDFTEFDAWVADRHAARTEALKEEMKESGLNAPIPGIADMKGQGRFYPCEPYGTCWEPNGGGNSLLAQGPAPTPAPRSATNPAADSGTSANPQEFFPCLPGAMANWYPRNAQITQAQLAGQGLGFGALADPWAWTVCHAGWWIHDNHRYVWVAGHKMHHQPPVHWFKFGKTAVFVPIHPKDVKGQAPLNKEHGFAPTKEKGGGFLMSPVRFDGTHSLEPMKSPPHEFRGQPTPPLARAEAPHMEMHAVKEVAAARAGMSPGGGIPLRFDHQTGGFTAPHTVVQGGHSTTTYASVGHSGGGYSGRSGGGSYSGGGGARGSGGGSGSSGGGGHSGGTSSSSASSSSISVSSSAPSASASPRSNGSGNH